MNKLILTAYLTLTLSTLTACSTSGHGTFVPAHAKDDQSIIYLYRPGTMSNAMYSPDILINDEVKFSIKNTSKRHITVDPGKYIIQIDTDENYVGTTSLTVDIKPAENIYIRVDTKLAVKKSIRFEPYERTFNLVRIETSAAIEEIAACCTSNNTKEVAVEQKGSSENKNETFSVDKTQNPFSH